MFRFTIRELVLITIIVALALGWGLSWRQLHRELREARNIAMAERAGRGAWEDQAMNLADKMREAGWKVEVSQRTASLQWPTPDAYKALVEEARDKAGNTR